MFSFVPVMGCLQTCPVDFLPKYSILSVDFTLVCVFRLCTNVTSLSLPLQGFLHGSIYAIVGENKSYPKCYHHSIWRSPTRQPRVRDIGAPPPPSPPQLPPQLPPHRFAKS